MKEKQVFYVNGFLGIIGILILVAIGVFFLAQEIFIGAKTNYYISRSSRYRYRYCSTESSEGYYVLR